MRSLERFKINDMIQLSKLKKEDLEVLKDAVHLKFTHLVLDKQKSEILSIHQSILQDVYAKFFDAYAKTYKKTEFKFKLKWHEAVLINKSLNVYTTETVNQYKKNVALKLILVLDPQTV